MISFFTSAYSLLRLAALRLAVSCGLISAANAVVVGPLLASQRTRGESVSREEKVAVVEAYLRGLAGKDISKIPFAANITFEGPRVGKLIGRNAVVGFLTSILPAVKSVQIRQHIVEGDFVATVFEMETIFGVDQVFDRVHVCDGELKEIHSFYYPQPNPTTGVP